eukprot:TRINITY_DN2082_c0_g1_i1.p1 TRINITY_DN2082_c0_g1~~TRINITY_DN2082_c0_g1_i1.p1  ORF type:complete len:1675 (+),score=342.28 TRINITY_DN2082_c0_g1_i1:702-5027(+)
MAHCSWCRINWGDAEGLRLTEIDRVLRPGGLFIWTSPASSWEDQQDAEWRKAMQDAVNNLCWTQKVLDGMTTIFEKPRDSDCHEKRAADVKPPMCNLEDAANDPNNVWDAEMVNCITPILKDVDPVEKNRQWPKVLSKLPARLAATSVTQEDLDKDTALWQQRFEEYERMTDIENPFDNVRNVIDMNAGFGGFAAALVKKPLWVLSTVPIEGTDNTVGSILDRGLMAILHNWCESFSTYPRTYDLLHANMVASMVEKRGCSSEHLLLEMDRMLRPRGWAIFRDEQKIIESVKAQASNMRWEIVKTTMVGLLPDGKTNEVILIVRKRYWVPPGPHSDKEQGSGPLKALLPGYDRFQVADPAAPISVCQENGPDWVPCHDVAFNKKANVQDRGYAYLERHCPKPTDMPKCLVPPPEGYKEPIPWPKSRDEVWLANVPHTKLATEKADQKWMTVDGDKVHFPGGGTFFKGGAEAYLAMIGKLLTGKDDGMVKDANVRLVLDIGCGVASFGGFLLDQDIISASFAPPDNHDAQVQFALERGIPAIIGSLASKRMPYPSSSFDLVHCSWCRIDWADNGGALLLEVDRVMRPGGYFVWTSPAAIMDDATDKEWREKMLSVTPNLCWTQVKKKLKTIVWQKPSTDECFKSRGAETQPPLCENDDNPVESPDTTWKKNVSTCLLPFSSKHISVDKLPKWPDRLYELNERLADTGVDEAKIAEDLKKWRQRVKEYWTWLGDDAGRIRNVMDMNAELGGFAAALYAEQKPVWVMNVVPHGGFNPTLPGVVDRGLLGVSHDWRQSFSTYPRTYDLLHADNLLSTLELRGGTILGLLLEMDRILRPHGYAIFHDEAKTARTISSLLPAMRWDIVVAAQYGNQNDVLLIARKRLWTPGGSPDEDAYVGGGGNGDESITSSEEYKELKLDAPGKPPLEACSDSTVDYVPCHDRKYAEKLGVPNSGYEVLERHCPPQDEVERCLVPPPPGYKSPIKWPKSKDEVWLSNVPHVKLAEYKSDQKWMEVADDKVLFPGGGTFGKEGAEGYLKKIAKLLLGGDEGNIKSTGIRLALDIGCGVASFGAALLNEDVIAASFAPNDNHDAQVQFALERGLPAVVNALASQKLLYPTGVFEMAHCSWCRIDWGHNDGALLLEIDRVLRPGAVFVWTSPAISGVSGTQKDHKEWFDKMKELTPRMCWTEEANDGKTVVWRKPVGSSSCKKTFGDGGAVPRCDKDAAIWHGVVEPCSSPMEGVPSVSQIPSWPKRLSALPTRLAGSGVSISDFEADTKVWKERVHTYWSWMGLEPTDVRNVIDMNANWGGFAAALQALDKPVWVMNTLHPSQSGELTGILDRGLLGQYHNWCEGFSTYPRTYDMLHASGLLSALKGEKKCNSEGVLLEMDRILRPQGWAIFRDDAKLVTDLATLIPSFRWTIVKSVQVGADAIIICKKDTWSSSSR